MNRDCYDSEEMRQVTIQEEGREAYRLGRYMQDNPYPVLSAEWENWIEGWELAHRETVTSNK